MHDGGKILAGLVVFLAVVLSPLWYHAVQGAESWGPPELGSATGGEECVEPTAYMRSLHMDLLNNWRDEAVRSEDRTYVGFGGKEYEKSLAGTCMNCHSNKEEFCDRCHEYVGVEPYCWDCHAEPVGM